MDKSWLDLSPVELFRRAQAEQPSRSRTPQVESLTDAAVIRDADNEMGSVHAFARPRFVAPGSYLLHDLAEK